MLRNFREFRKFTKFLSNPRFHVSRTFSVDCSKTSNHNHRVGNGKLHTRNMVRAKSNDRLLRYLPRTPKKYRLALVPDLANFPLFPYYFLLPEVNLLKATQEVTNGRPWRNILKIRTYRSVFGPCHGRFTTDFILFPFATGKPTQEVNKKLQKGDLTRVTATDKLSRNLPGNRSMGISLLSGISPTDPILFPFPTCTPTQNNSGRHLSLAYLLTYCANTN